MTESTRKGIIAFSITDRGALYSAYMAFVTNGGIFVPTARQFELDDDVFLLLQLMDDEQMHAVEGRVVWVTPAGAQGNKVQGIGIQFSDDDNGKTKTEIEQHLAATLNSDRLTHTM